MPITMSMVLSTATRFACEWAAAPRRARQAEPSHLARRAPQMPLNAVRNSAAVLNPGRWSIRTQLMVFCVVIAVVPLLVLEYVDNARARESLAQGTDKAMLLTAQSTAATIDRLNEDRLQMATQIAANSLVSAKAAGLDINSEPLAAGKATGLLPQIQQQFHRGLLHRQERQGSRFDRFQHGRHQRQLLQLRAKRPEGGAVLGGYLARQRHQEAHDAVQRTDPVW